MPSQTPIPLYHRIKIYFVVKLVTYRKTTLMMGGGSDMYFVKITLMTEEEEIESVSKDFENAEDAKNAFDDSAADLLCMD